mgnify:CR=1 FL=1
MSDISKLIKVGNLLSTYKDLLSSTQQEILSSYYTYNLSISEIASERNISRAAVEDALSKGVKKLEEFEKNLKIVEKNEEILKITAKLKQNSEIKEDIEKIERIIDNGI